MNPLPETVPSYGWHYTPEDWDSLLVPMELGDTEGMDAAITAATLARIRRRYGKAGIRARLAGLPAALVTVVTSRA